MIHAVFSFLVSRSISDDDRVFGTDIRISSNFNVIVFSRIDVCIGLISLFGGRNIGSLLSLLHSFNGLLGSRDHIVFGVDLILPVGHLIHTKSHSRPNLSSNGRRFDCSDNLMLEFSHNIVNEEYSCSGCKHAHWNVVKSESSSSVFANLDVISLAIDGLDLQILG